MVIYDVSEITRMLVFVVFAIVLGLVFLILPNLLVPKDLELEKLSSYECGFDPFQETTHDKFDVRFYLVAILFIIFDIEVAFLIPWALVLGNLGFMGFVTMVFFLFILLIGFVFEWSQGALDWE